MENRYVHTEHSDAGWWARVQGINDDGDIYASINAGPCPELHEAIDLAYRYVAENRIQATPTMQPFRKVLLTYDWPNYSDHIAWVATAKVSEIVNGWARHIEDTEVNKL